MDYRSSLPFFLRWYITKFFPSWVIEEIDEEGYWHDIALAVSPEKWRKHNKTYLCKLDEKAIPRHLVAMLEAGLFIYWRSPAWLKRLMWKLVPMPQG